MSFIVYHLMWLKLTTLNMVSIRSLEWQGKNGTIHLREDIQNYRFENQNRHPMHVYRGLTKSEHMHISRCGRKYAMRSSSHLITCSIRMSQICKQYKMVKARLLVREATRELDL